MHQPYRSWMLSQVFGGGPASAPAASWNSGPTLLRAGPPVAANPERRLAGIVRRQRPATSWEGNSFSVHTQEFVVSSDAPLIGPWDWLCSSSMSCVFFVEPEDVLASGPPLQYQKQLTDFGIELHGGNEENPNLNRTHGTKAHDME